VCMHVCEKCVYTCKYMEVCVVCTSSPVCVCVSSAPSPVSCCPLPSPSPSPSPSGTHRDVTVNDQHLLLGDKLTTDLIQGAGDDAESLVSLVED